MQKYVPICTKCLLLFIYTFAHCKGKGFTPICPNPRNTITMQIHIGSIIRDELRQQGHTNEWFAEQLSINSRTVNKLFLKPSMDTQRLLQICKVLDTDFFAIYSKELSSLPNMGKLPTLGRENTEK